ncbi:MAG TPA: hypothetical protein VF233_12410 [Nitrososphaeraceae archaeon]
MKYRVTLVNLLFVDVGMEISNNSVKPSSFNNEQKQKLARLPRFIKLFSTPITCFTKNSEERQHGAQSDTF